METIVVDCSGCKARLKVKLPPGRSGGEIKCPKCGAKTAFGKNTPGAESVPAPAAPTPAPAVPSPAPVPPPAPAPIAPAAQKPPVTPVVIPPKVDAKSVEAATVPEEPKAEVKKPAVPIVLGAGADQGAPSLLAKCPSCQWQTKLLPAFAGKKIRCKQCGGIIQVGEESAAPAATPAPTVQPGPVSVVIPPAIKPQSQGPLPGATAPTPVLIQSAPVPPMTGIKPLSGLGVVSPVAAAVQSPATPASKAELQELQEQLAHARHRAEEAEKALHDMAGQRAVESVALNRKVADLERRLSEYKALFAEIASDYKGEMEAAERRAALLRQRLAKFSA